MTVFCRQGCQIFLAHIWNLLFENIVSHIRTEETVLELRIFLLFLDKCAFYQHSGSSCLVTNEGMAVKGILSFSLCPHCSVLSFSISDWLIWESSRVGKDEKTPFSVFIYKCDLHGSKALRVARWRVSLIPHFTVCLS